MTTENPTKVIFRKWEKYTWRIIAIFPEVVSCDNPYKCLSWEYVGEHGSCDPCEVINNTFPATFYDYSWDKKYLEEHYGYQLKVITRNRPEFLETRKTHIDLIRLALDTPLQNGYKRPA
jgi:hypothetical protein